MDVYIINSVNLLSKARVPASFILVCSVCSVYSELRVRQVSQGMHVLLVCNNEFST